MKFTIRRAEESDFQAILDIIKALAHFEKAPEKVTNTVEQMKAEKDYFNCLVAVGEDGVIVAICLYFFAYYTWVGKSLYLDDLYVLEPYRRHGIAAALLNELFEIARREKCNRVRWQVLDWNTSAINFYKKIGATLDNEWVNCDFDRKAIQEFGRE
ncbi:MAG: GNAT family N-acetyltransferase [Tannerella sp.]|jgi:GNAT superfamily N-acetyltransferase|nr:GNAT family N-acetyltransferase [Tannerella sp.]